MQPRAENRSAPRRSTESNQIEASKHTSQSKSKSLSLKGMGSSSVCNFPSTAFGGDFKRPCHAECRQKCKCIRRKVAGGGAGGASLAQEQS